MRNSYARYLLCLFPEPGPINHALVAGCISISFRVLDFPDLTADGVFPFWRCCRSGVVIIADANPWLACIFGMLAGVLGLVTAWLACQTCLPAALQYFSDDRAVCRQFCVLCKPNLALLGEPTIFGER